MKNKESYGLQSVSASWYGVHLSAGLIEGLVELIRYNSDFEKRKMLSVNDFQLDQMIGEQFNPIQVDKILANSTLKIEGKEVSIFDLT